MARNVPSRQQKLFTQLCWNFMKYWGPFLEVCASLFISTVRVNGWQCISTNKSSKFDRTKRVWMEWIWMRSGHSPVRFHHDSRVASHTFSGYPRGKRGPSGPADETAIFSDLSSTLSIVIDVNIEDLYVLSDRFHIFYLIIL